MRDDIDIFVTVGFNPVLSSKIKCEFDVMFISVLNHIYNSFKITRNKKSLNVQNFTAAEQIDVLDNMLSSDFLIYLAK